MQGVPVELAVALTSTFVAAALLAGLATSLVLSARSPERRRLREVIESPSRTRGAAKARRTGDGSQAASAWLRSMRKTSLAEKRLATAGYRGRPAVLVFRVAQTTLAVLAGGAILLVMGWESSTDWVAAALAALGGSLLPAFFVERRIAQRRREIRNGLPDVLDLLIVCLEAGSSLDQSVVKATEELALTYPVLAEELRVLIAEIRAGKPRIDAFRTLAQRTRVDEVRSLAAMLAQADRFGTSVGQALRTLASDMRTRRRQGAEEQANKVGVRLVFPLVLCLFPAFFVVVLGPAAVRIMRAFADVGR
ncbi:MAG: type II secretion system F family protein [Acidobacteria bacterium]|nr:type II secretion system F family protein [Acidobacteriota bacterium]